MDRVKFHCRNYTLSLIPTKAVSNPVNQDAKAKQIGEYINNGKPISENQISIYSTVFIVYHHSSILNLAIYSAIFT